MQLWHARPCASSSAPRCCLQAGLNAAAAKAQQRQASATAAAGSSTSAGGRPGTAPSSAGFADFGRYDSSGRRDARPQTSGTISSSGGSQRAGSAGGGGGGGSGSSGNTAQRLVIAHAESGAEQSMVGVRAVTIDRGSRGAFAALRSAPAGGDGAPWERLAHLGSPSGVEPDARLVEILRGGVAAAEAGGRAAAAEHAALERVGADLSLSAVQRGGGSSGLDGSSTAPHSGPGWGGGGSSAAVEVGGSDEASSYLAAYLQQRASWAGAGSSGSARATGGTAAGTAGGEAASSNSRFAVVDAPTSAADEVR